MEPVEPPNQVVTTATEPAILGPRTRILRTLLQAAAALAVAVPAAAKAFNMSAANTAKVTAAMGVLTVLASVLHNTYDSKQAAKTTPADVGALSVSLLLLVVACICFAIFTLAAHGTITTDEGFTWLGAGLFFGTLAKFA